MIFNHLRTLTGVTAAARFTLAVSAALLVSCIQIEDVDDGVGYLDFRSLSVDVAVDDLKPTKAAVPSENIPTDDDFTYIVTGKADGKEYYNSKGIPSDPVVLPKGTYKVEVVYGANEFGQPYYAASEEEVAIDVGQTETLEFSDIPLANAMVAVTLPDMTGHMSISSVTLSEGGNVHEIQAGKYYFAPSGREVAVSFSGVNAVGEEKEVICSLGVLSPKHAYDVVCNLDLPSLEFTPQSTGAIAGRLYLTSLAAGGEGVTAANIGYQVSADGGSTWKAVTPVAGEGYWVITQMQDGTKFETEVTYKIRAVYGGLASDPWEFTPSMPAVSLNCGITHTYESSVLTGSTAVVTGTGPTYSGIVESLISSKGVDLINPKGTVVRTLTTDTGTMTVSNDWPYIPQGDGTYALQPYFVIGGEKVYLSPTPASSPAPEFTLTLSAAYTSYDKYAAINGITQDINGANNCDPATLYNAGASWGISTNIMKNTNYTKKLVIDIDGDTSSTYDREVTSFDANSHTEDISGLPWSAHTLKVSFTFDGKTTDSKTQTHHITGLPYKAPTMVESHWSLASWNCEYDNGVIKLGGVSGSGECTATSTMKFHIPKNIGVKVNTNVTVRAYRFFGYINTDFTVSVGGSEIIKQNSNDEKDGKNYNLSGTSTFTTSSSTIRLNSSYTAAGPWSKVHSIYVLYN